MKAAGRTSRLASTGFTLVEVLMAMLIMMVGLLGLLQSVNVAYEHNVRNRLREEALLVGEEQMNIFRSLTTNSSLAYSNSLIAVRTVAGINKNFSITRENQPMSSTRRLKVTVGWSFRKVSTSHAIYTLKSM